jgi:hypothetical protein
MIGVTSLLTVGCDLHKDKAMPIVPNSLEGPRASQVVWEEEVQGGTVIQIRAGRARLDSRWQEAELEEVRISAGPNHIVAKTARLDLGKRLVSGRHFTLIGANGAVGVNGDRIELDLEKQAIRARDIRLVLDPAAGGHLIRGRGEGRSRGAHPPAHLSGTPGVDG